MSAAERVGVVGGGRWGLALACAAHRTGARVTLMTRRGEPEAQHRGITVVDAFKPLAEGASLILVAVPSEVMPGVARSLGEVVDGSHFLVHGVRGLSHEGLHTLTDVLRAETAARRVGALAGPVTADDLIDGRPAVIAMASRYPEVNEAVIAALGGPLLRVSTTQDLTGLEWASALVGCLVIALGYGRALNIAPGLLAGLLTRGIHEASQLAAAAGAEEKTFYTIAGIGDLMAAMGQDHRPEARLGAALALGDGLDVARQKAGQRIEAITLMPRVVALAKRERVEAPVFETIARALTGSITPQEILSGLMTRR
ncbi:MAG: NAD-binding protein [Myxococcales bacterium]|nr:NAD-binding protein [Myxococcales bacterium]